MLNNLLAKKFPSHPVVPYRRQSRWRSVFQKRRRLFTMLFAVGASFLASTQASATDGPLGLSGQVYSSSALEIFWERQPAPAVDYRIDSSDGSSEILDATSFFVESLEANTDFTFTVTALDANSAELVTDSIQLTTLSANNGNGLASSTVEDLRGEVYSSSAIEIFWDVSNAPAGITFAILRDGELVTTTDGRSFFEEGLASGSAFTYTVEPSDGGAAASVTLTTLGDGGFASSTVEDLRGEVYSSSAIEIFWDVSNAPVGITFAILRDGELVTTTDGRSFFEEGLASGSAFTYSVEPSDGGAAASVTLTTLGDAGADEGILAQGNCPIVGNLTPLEIGGNQCQISGELIADGTLSSDIEWFLEGGLVVGSEEISATLTIDAGTQIRGDNAGAVDYLLVYPGSSMFANGTSSNPIHFLSDDDNVDGSAEWGGVFLRGFNGTDRSDAQQGENLLDYVVIAEAGASSTITVAGREVTYTDNLVVNGVDETTRLTFVQSHNSARDGIHILNSNARMSWVLVTGAGRDGIWYRNFTGLIKDLMVIHNRDADGTSGRSGIYASETEAGNSNPRIVNATLVGRDSTSDSTGGSGSEFGILFADNTDQIRMGNVLIANFRNGCYVAESAADLSQIDTTIPGPNYLDGVHCANEAGANGNFGVVRDGSTGFPDGTVASNNSNGDGFVYYNGAGPVLPIANTAFNVASGGLNFTGELVDRTANFTAGWYLDNIRGVGNGLAGNPAFLNGFLDGDTNRDGVVDSADTSSPFIIADDGVGGFNQDVAADTGGYDMTHVGAVRGGAVTNVQFDNWTVDTGPDSSFTVQVNPANL